MVDKTKDGLWKNTMGKTSKSKSDIVSKYSKYGRKGDPLTANRTIEQIELGRVARGEGAPGVVSILGPDALRSQYVNNRKSLQGNKSFEETENLIKKALSKRKKNVKP